MSEDKIMKEVIGGELISNWYCYWVNKVWVDLVRTCHLEAGCQIPTE